MRVIHGLPYLLFPANPRSARRVSHFSTKRRRRIGGATRRWRSSRRCVSAEVVKERENGVVAEESGSTQALFGSALLLGVAVLWGSYAPALKFIFSTPRPPLPSTLSFVKSTLATTVLTLNYLRLRSSADEPDPVAPKNVSYSSGAKGKLGAALLWKSGSLLWTVVELGLWETFGTFSQTIGISLTSTTSAAFLMHSVTVFTPILASFTGDVLSAPGWLGCVLSLLGCVCVTLDVAPDGGVVSVGSIGDGFILLAALFYSLATVRLGTLGRDFKPAQLAVGNAIIGLSCAALWLLTDLTRLPDVHQLWPGWQEWLPWIVIGWIAVGPDSLAPLLRNRGQQILPPSRAQLLFASTPFWSALIAALVLHTDTLSLGTWIGGACILIGALLSSFHSQQRDPNATSSF